MCGRACAAGTTCADGLCATARVGGTAPESPGSQDTLLTIQSPSAVRIDEDYVYWIEKRSRRIQRLGRRPAIAATSLVAQLADASRENAYSRLLAIDSPYLYFFSEDANGASTLNRIHRCGGEPLPIAASVGDQYFRPTSLVVGGAYVYFSHGNVLTRTTK